MKDIDRNINLIIYDNLARITNFTDSSVNFSDYELLYSLDTIYTNKIAKELIFNKQLPKGEYYYIHAVSPVNTNNNPCVFSVSSTETSKPFFTYYAQSPLSESNINTYYAYRFNFENSSYMRITRNIAIQPEYNFKGIIYIMRRK